MNNQSSTSTNSLDNSVAEETPYVDYQPAYQTGHEGYDRYLGKSFDEAETELKRDYEAILAKTNEKGLEWNKVKDAVRDAWDKAGTT